MTFPPPALLFPSRRYVVQWLMGSAGVCIFMFATDGANWIFVGATVMAAFWAADCLGRLRQWLGGALVPGYAATAWLVVLAIIASVVVLGALLSHMAGNPMPTFALAMCIGLCTVLGVVYAERWATGRAAIIAIFVAAFVPVFLTARGHIDVGVHSRLPGLGRAVPDGVMHWAALVGAGAATFALKRRLDRPTQQSRGMRTMPWRQYRSFLVAPKHILVGWYSRTSLAEWLIPGMTMLVVVPHYLLVLGEERAFHGWEGPIHVGVCWWLYVGSLTPLMLLKGAGTWLGTAWRLGQGASRPALGRAFATRVVWATACSFGIALNLVVVHAYLGGVSVPPVARHLLFFEEVLLVYAVGLLAATWALTTHPSRTTTQPDFRWTVGSRERCRRNGLPHGPRDRCRRDPCARMRAVRKRRPVDVQRRACNSKGGLRGPHGRVRVVPKQPVRTRSLAWWSWAMPAVSAKSSRHACPNPALFHPPWPRPVGTCCQCRRDRSPARRQSRRRAAERLASAGCRSYRPPARE